MAVMVKKEDSMIKNLKLLITDIDGTLVNTNRDMLDITRAVLKDLHNRGVYLGIASGRPLGIHIYEGAEEWGTGFDYDVWIGMNGGQLQDNVRNERNDYYQLQPKEIKEIIELMEPMDANPFLYIGEDMMSLYIDEEMVASMKRHNFECTTVNQLSDFWAHETNKLLFRLKSADQMPAVEKYLSEHRSDKYAFFKTQPTMMEFQDARINKGFAMEQFCKNNNISLDEVMAFGDTTNDNEMLKMAGWSVCLKQGSDDTKACADVVTDYTNDEDGFGRYILDHVYPAMGWKLP